MNTAIVKLQLKETGGDAREKIKKQIIINGDRYKNIFANVRRSNARF